MFLRSHIWSIWLLSTQYLKPCQRIICIDPSTTKLWTVNPGWPTTHNPALPTGHCAPPPGPYLGRVERCDDPHTVCIVVILNGKIGGGDDARGTSEVGIAHAGCQKERRNKSFSLNSTQPLPASCPLSALKRSTHTRSPMSCVLAQSSAGSLQVTVPGAEEGQSSHAMPCSTGHDKLPRQVREIPAVPVHPPTPLISLWVQTNTQLL